MKAILLSLLCIIAFGNIAGLSTAQAQNSRIGKKVRKEPFTERRYYSDKKHWRAVATGKSQDLTHSKEKALLMAKQRLASLIQSTVKSTTDRYVNSVEINEKEDFMQKFDNLTREVVRQTIADIRIIGEEPRFIRKEKKFNTYIAIEINKEQMLDAMAKAVTANERLKVDYNKMKYQEIFDKEMDKLEGQGEKDMKKMQAEMEKANEEE